MKKEILNTIIRFSEESKNDADAIYYPNFEKLAEELDALFAKRIVINR